MNSRINLKQPIIFRLSTKVVTTLVVTVIGLLMLERVSAQSTTLSDFDKVIVKSAQQMIGEGRRIFRFDTFGDEAFWGGALRSA